MEQEEYKIKDVEHIKDKVKVIFASILGALLLLVELYLMINSPMNYIAIALFAVLILGDLYFLVTSLIEISYRRDQNRREQYDGIYRAEKASYMLFRKYFDSLAQTLTSMDEKLEMPAEEIISAQKAVAKVTINRSKENTDALMNSNDKLIEKLFEFQDMLSENNEKLLEKTAEANSQNSRENEARLGEIAGKMREMELSIKNEIYQTINKMVLSGQVVAAPSAAGMPAQPETGFVGEPAAGYEETPMFAEQAEAMEELPSFDQLPIDEMPSMESEALDEPAIEGFDGADEAISGFDAAPVIEPTEEASFEAEPGIEFDAMSEAGVMPEEAVIPEAEMLLEPEGTPETEMMAEPLEDLAPEREATEALEAAPEIEAMAEPEPVAEEVPPMPDMSDPNKQMNPDEIAALIANMNAEPAAETVEEAAPEPETVTEPEPVAEEVPPMPDMSDPNKQMNPDEIAALIANMNAEPAAEAVEEAVPEPEAIAEPVAEEVPPMPDMSDPNKQMNPDEIAALIANMNAEPAAEAVEEAVPEPEAIAEPVAEEVPPMPDLSDPNKMMTPDEIEALFANM